MKPVTITTDRFEADVLDSDLPVLIDFWAPWCGPCRAIAPALDPIAAEYAGRLTVAKVNIDEEPTIAREGRAGRRARARVAPDSDSSLRWRPASDDRQVPGRADRGSPVEELRAP